MRDFRLLAWLRWRQWRSSALYWLRTLGYDPQRQNFIDRLYALYLILFGAAWVSVIALAAVAHAAELGRGLSPAATQRILDALPWLFIVVAVYLIARNLRKSPLLLSFPDVAYVAASPVSRVAIILVNFIQSCLQYAVVVLPILALVTVVIAQPLGQPLAQTASLRAAAVAAPLIPLLLAVSWIVGLARLGRRESRWSRYWWLAALLLAPLAWLFPPLRWPGAAVSLAVAAPLAPLRLASLWMVALVATVLLAVSARRVNITDAIEESRTYASLNALGFMTVLAPDLTARIKRRDTLTNRKPKFRLAPGRGASALVARSALLTLRHPTMLLQVLFWGFGAAASGAWLIFSKPPLDLWFFWVSFLAVAPPRPLVETFEGDVNEPYLRQLLPVSNLPLALLSSVVPFGVALLGVWGGWSLSAFQFRVTKEEWTLGMGLGAALVLIVLLAQAAAAARVGIFGWRPPYAGWFLLSVALVGASIAWLQPFPGALVGVAAALGLLALIVATSPPVPLD